MAEDLSPPPPLPRSLNPPLHLHTSAYVSIRQHPSAYVSIRQNTPAYVSIRQHTSAYVSIRQHTAADVLCNVLRTIARFLRSAALLSTHRFHCTCIRQHTSACASIRQHTSAYAPLPLHLLRRSLPPSKRLALTRPLHALQQLSCSRFYVCLAPRAVLPDFERCLPRATQHTVSIRQHTSAYVSIRQHTYAACVASCCHMLSSLCMSLCSSDTR